MQQIIFAQDEEIQEKKPFKEHLFTGGSISLVFYNNTFLIGGNPVFGYTVGKWIDLGVVANYSYSSEHGTYGDYLHQTTYGGGAFTKIYPLRSIFLQAQFEHNFINQKYFPYSNAPVEKANVDANSLLVGAGYTTGRFPGQTFFYFAILVDVLGQDHSPYLYNDPYRKNEIIPIVRTGIQIPLFQGKNDESY
jgi:hypothetical protein